MTSHSTARPDPLELALRAFAVPHVPPSTYEAPDWTRRHPEYLLVFDTETTLDPAQRLTFGCARLYRPRGTKWESHPVSGPPRFECLEEYLFYGDSVSEDELAVIDSYVAPFPITEYHGQVWDSREDRFVRQAMQVRTDEGVPILVRSRRDFVRFVFMPMAYRARSLIVAFNMPFDLSRLALDWSELRRTRRKRDATSGELPARTKPWDAFEGGFGLALVQETRSDEEDTFRPRIAIKTLDSKRHLIQFRGGVGADAEQEVRFRGHFLDLRTLAFGLTNESHSLRSACETFETEHGKDDHQPTGLVTPEELTYGRHDVRATFELAEKLLAEYALHPVSPDHPAETRAPRPRTVTQVYSPASVGKSYLDAMGITPPLQRWPDFPKDVIGKAMTSFYGGRAECRIRHVPVPVRYLDFTSMYPTVNGLMRLWDLLTAAEVRIVEATAQVQALLDAITPERVFDAALWPSFRALVELEPDGDILPTRAAYEGEGVGWQIGVNPLTAHRPLWFALPDVVAACLLAKRVPRIRRALRLEPEGRLAGMRAVSLRGQLTVDPSIEDFFLRVIEQRNALPDRDGVDKPLSDFLKVLANASSYGVYAEMIRHELPRGEQVPVTVYALDDPHDAQVAAPEEPGSLAFPPLATLITSAARLMLALLERSVTDLDGSFLMTDTDSMAVVSTEEGGLVPCPGGPFELDDGTAAVKATSWSELDAIRNRFGRLLNPYQGGAVGDILKLEDENYTPAPTEKEPRRVDKSRPVQLHAFAISAKRYCLYNLESDGSVTLRKHSEHGLGHLLNPDDPDEPTRAWIKLVWHDIVSDEMGRSTQPLPFAARPAVSRITVGSQPFLQPFADHNRGKDADEQVRPFNFMLSANVAPFGHPAGADPARFHLVSRYERDASRWLRMRWIDRYDRKHRTYEITTGPRAGDQVRVKSIADVLAEYRVHPEPKSFGPDGKVCGPDTVGLLSRRPVEAASFALIGKEANELEAVDEGLAHDLGDVVTGYGVLGDPWVEFYLPALQEMPTGRLAASCGVDRKTIQRTKAGTTSPSPRLRKRLEALVRQDRPL